MTTPTEACLFCSQANTQLVVDGLVFQVACLCCGATGSRCESRQDAISAWNRLHRELGRARAQHAHHFSETLRALGANWEDNAVASS